MPMPQEQKGNMSAVIAIIGFLDVPLVFFATRLWRSIHPAVFNTEGGGLEPEMVAIGSTNDELIVVNPDNVAVPSRK